MSQLARWAFSVQPSSASSERVFSKGGRILSRLRQSMNASTVWQASLLVSDASQCATIYSVACLSLHHYSMSMVSRCPHAQPHPHESQAKPFVKAHLRGRLTEFGKTRMAEDDEAETKSKQYSENDDVLTSSDGD